MNRFLLAVAVALAPMIGVAAEPAGVVLEDQRGWFGVQLEQVDDEVRVREVIEGTPAADAGLVKGDALLSYDGAPVREIKAFVGQVKESPPGRRAQVVLRRDGREREVTVLIGAHPGARALLRSEIVGKPARAVVATDLDGGAPLDLGSYRGKVVLVDFWEPWCGPCIQAMPDLAKLHLDRADAGLVIIGLAGDDPAKVRATIKRRSVPYTIGLDADARTSGDWFVTTLPTVFLVDREGVVREMFVGSTPKQDIERAVDALLAE